ncbi:MAG: hypothetical protein AAF431_19405, partial [Pseudomonadota bacterium]
GSTQTELPANVTSRFQGTYENTTGSQMGTVTIDIVETPDGSVTGNIIFQSSGSNCLRNAPVTGTSTGFNLSLTADQAGLLFTTTVTVTTASGFSSETVTISTTGRVGSTSVTNSDGSTTSTVVTSEQTTGTLNMTFTITNNGANLGGTYVVSGNTCSNQSGSGDMTLIRS